MFRIAKQFMLGALDYTQHIAIEKHERKVKSIVRLRRIFRLQLPLHCELCQTALAQQLAATAARC